MKVSVLATLTVLAACVSAVPAPVPHVVHEKRSNQMQKWSRRDVKLSRDTIIPVSIGLAQSNLDNGYEFLMDVSHPGSPNFGKHWSMEKIKQTFAPSKDTIAAVKSWLIDSGIESDRITLSKSMTWVKFDATIGEAESLLKTEYNVYTHATTGDDFLAVEEYSVPAHIQDKIDFITPTVHFDLAVKSKSKRTDLEGRAVENIRTKRPIPQIHPDPLRVPLGSVKFNLTNCNRYITPECLQALYQLPNGTAGAATYSVVEYTPQSYVQSDLDLVFKTLGLPIPAGTGPSPVDFIDGAVLQHQVENFNVNGESNLDLIYAIGLLYPQNVGLYEVGDLVQGASFNNFLDALDASYCSYEGGDDPTQDGVYPDPYPGGYTKQDCGTVTPAQVISTSYGYNEADLTAFYEQRQCNEYMKLGLAGVSVLYSSGDYGVAGNGGECCVLPGCASGQLSKNGTVFNPSFPSTCPYVTSVGATQVKHAYSVTATKPEAACETVIYSGGGFSNVFPMPAYQADALGFYFEHHTPDQYNSTIYNDSQKTRGFPDVSANGANYVIAVDGKLSLVYGTSASSPVFGSIVTMINNERLAAGKGPVGFLNPTLYSNPEALNDITLGDNQGCGTQGFRAVKGWDPLTGLGTPNYPKLLEVFMALP